MTGELFVGAFLGWVANLALHQITTRTSEFSRRIDDLCAEITNLADLSTQYWLISNSDPSEEILRAKILGKQHWMQAAITMLTEDVWYFSWNIEDQVFDFMDALTGGEFGAQDRAPDFGKSVSVQGLASELVHSIRRERRSIGSSWF